MHQGALQEGAQHGQKLANHEMVEPQQLSIASDFVAEVFLTTHRDDQHRGDTYAKARANKRRRKRVETQRTKRS